MVRSSACTTSLKLNEKAHRYPVEMANTSSRWRSRPAAGSLKGSQGDSASRGSAAFPGPRRHLDRCRAAHRIGRGPGGSRPTRVIPKNLQEESRLNRGTVPGMQEIPRCARNDTSLAPRSYRVGTTAISLRPGPPIELAEGDADSLVAAARGPAALAIPAAAVALIGAAAVVVAQ